MPNIRDIITDEALEKLKAYDEIYDIFWYMSDESPSPEDFVKKIKNIIFCHYNDRS